MLTRTSFPEARRRPREVNASSRRRGATATLVAIMAPVLIGMTALAIDVGHLQLVRQELQSSAVAGAGGSVASGFVDGISVGVP